MVDIVIFYKNQNVLLKNYLIIKNLYLKNFHKFVFIVKQFLSILRSISLILTFRVTFDALSNVIFRIVIEHLEGPLRLIILLFRHVPNRVDIFQQHSYSIMENEMSHREPPPPYSSADNYRGAPPSYYVTEFAAPQPPVAGNIMRTGTAPPTAVGGTV